jgi:S1-C subfamily serine protease
VYCTSQSIAGEFESNEEGSGDGSESDGEQSNAASEPATPQHITGGETGDTVPTPTIEEVQEEGILFSCSIEKAERGFGFVFDWTDNAVRVKGVQPNGPASHMLSIGDKIIYANGKRLSDLDEAKKLFQAVPIGGKLELRYCRLEFQRVA